MNHSKKIIIGLLIIIVVCLVSIASLYRKINTIKSPNQVGQDEVMRLVSMVGKLVILPSNERPTIATVTNPEKLRDQPFFSNARSGDRVLIYELSKKAILYREAENKIIEISPLN